MEMLRTLKRIRRRLVWNRVWAFMVRATFCGLCVGCVVVGVHKFFPLPVQPAWAMGTLIALAIAGGMIWGLLARPSLLYAAVCADKRLQLDERLSSAYALAERSEQTPMVPALIDDANAVARSINVRKAFPLRPPRETRFVVIPLAVYLLVWGVVPETDPFGRRQAIEEHRVAVERARAQIVKLEKLSRKIKLSGKGKRIEIEAQGLAREIDEAVRELREHDLCGTKAMARVSKLSDAIRKKEEAFNSKKQMPPPLKLPVGRPGDFKLMKEVAKKLSEGQYEEAAKKLAEITKALQKHKLSKKNVERLRKEIEKMAERAKQLPELKKALEKAAAALAHKDARKALENMQAAAMTLDDMQAAKEQLELLAEAFGQVNAIKKGFGRPRRWKYCRNCGALLRTEQEIWTGFCDRCRRAGLDRQEANGGFGGAGIGRGGTTGPLGTPPVEFDRKKIHGMLGKGKILGALSFRGKGEKGEATLNYVETFMEYRQKAEDALEKEEIPLGYKNYVRRYFDAVQPKQKPKSR